MTWARYNDRGTCQKLPHYLLFVLLFTPLGEVWLFIMIISLVWFTFIIVRGGVSLVVIVTVVALNCYFFSSALLRWYCVLIVTLWLLYSGFRWNKVLLFCCCIQDSALASVCGCLIFSSEPRYNNIVPIKYYHISLKWRIICGINSFYTINLIIIIRNT